LGALLAFGLVQAGLFALAESDLIGAGILRSFPGYWGIQFISEPGVESTGSGRRFYTFNGSVAHRILENLWDVLTLEWYIVGASRKEAMQMVVGGYAAAVAICAVSVPTGLVIGEWLCRLALRPSYWMLGAIKRQRWTMLKESVLPAVLWAYAVTVPTAVIHALFFDAFGSGLAGYATPTLGWSLVLLSAPVVSAAFCVVREYARAVRAHIGPSDYLCDCDYECAPGKQCPECGAVTRALPAALRWRWQR